MLSLKTNRPPRTSHRLLKICPSSSVSPSDLTNANAADLTSALITSRSMWRSRTERTFSVAVAKKLRDRRGGQGSSVGIFKMCEDCHQ